MRFTQILQFLFLNSFISVRSLSFNDSACNKLGSCGVYDEQDILRCHCDGLCHFYGDCCHGYRTVSPDEKKDVIRSHHADFARYLSCQSVKGQSHKFWLVHGDVNVKSGIKHQGKLFELCTSAVDPVFSLIPVFDNRTQLHFSNLYCAYLHGQTDTTSLVLWKVKVAGCAYKIGAYVTKLNIIGGMTSLYELYKYILNDPSCRIQFDPPPNSQPRICFTTDSKCIGTEFHDACFAFQNPVLRVTHKGTESTSLYKRYRNYVCEKCESHADYRTDDKTLCRPKETVTDVFAADKTLILSDVDLETLFYTFIQPLICEINGEVKTKGSCRVLECEDGLLQNYLVCTNPIQYVLGIKFELNFELVENNNIKLFQSERVETVLQNALKTMFENFRTLISHSEQIGVQQTNMKPCKIYNYTVEIISNDILDIKRSQNLSTEVPRKMMKYESLFEDLGFASFRLSETGNSGNESVCSAVTVHILCPKKETLLVIFRGLSAGSFATSLIFEFSGVSLGSFARFEFVSFKIVYLLHDVINIVAILLACNNFALILHNTEVVLHWLSLASDAWLCIIGHQIWQTMTYSIAPLKVINHKFSKQTSCFTVFLSTGSIVVLSYLTTFLEMDSIAISYDHGGTLFRSNFDFVEISLFLFVPHFFATTVAGIFCISVLIGSRHERNKIENSDHWLVQNIRLFILLSAVIIKDIIYASKPYLNVEDSWGSINAASFCLPGVLTVLLEIALQVWSCLRRK